MPTERQSFTISYGKSVCKLLAPAAIQPILTAREKTQHLLLKATALWDTGATVTCIHPAVFKRLNLCFWEDADDTVIRGVGSETRSKFTFVNLYLSHNFILKYCPVFVADIPEYVDIIIGMDIIRLGDFAICNVDNNTSFSFAIPPFPERINFANIAGTVS